MTTSKEVPRIAGSNERADMAVAARRGPLALLERVTLAALSMLVSINVCTGFPLLALWIGSRAASGNIFSWIGIITAIISLAGLATFGVATLTRLSARYDKVTGRPPPSRQPRPWELSMSAEPAAPTGRARRGTNPVEVIVVLTVVVAFIAFEIWFFFFAGPVY
jgi:hypothetical protein